MSEISTGLSRSGPQLLRSYGTKLSKSIHTVALAIALGASFGANGAEDVDDETLRFYLSKSALVVVGEFTSDPFGFRTELGVVHRTAEFRIDEIIKGERPAKEKFNVDIVRYDFGSLLEKSDRDRPAEVKLGGKCILFLNAHGRTTDAWFGVQPPYPSMIRSLKRLTSEQSGKLKEK